MRWGVEEGTSGDKQTVAVLGLGAMGSRIARRLLDGERRVVVWNRTREKVDELVADGAASAATPAAAAEQADVVITMLTDPAALAEVSEGDGGFAAALREGQTVVEMSTVGPAAIARLRAALPDGVALLDAPVLGSLDEATSGSLTIFVGGSDEGAERVAPLLRELGTPLRVGATGSGAVAKLVANSTLFGVLAALGEALALADGLGLEREVAYEVLARTPLAAQAERRRESVETASYPRRFGLSLARKDAALVVEAAESAGVDLRVAAAALAWLVDAERSGAGDSDYTAMLATIAPATG